MTLPIVERLRRSHGTSDLQLEAADTIEELVQALKPFADCVDQIADDEDDEEWAKFRLLIKDYRRAAKALQSLPQARTVICPTCHGEFDEGEWNASSECPECEAPKAAPPQEADDGPFTTTVAPEGQVTEAMWGGLARDIMMWLDFGTKTPRTLFDHLKATGREIPQWLRDEPEMQSLDHVPSKGTRCVLIYKAMQQALTTPAADEDAELRIVFDGPPSHDGGRFVDCETADGKSINVGQWHERGDGLWELRIAERIASKGADDGLRDAVEALLRQWKAYQESDLSQMNAHDILVRYELWNALEAALSHKERGK